MFTYGHIFYYYYLRKNIITTWINFTNHYFKYTLATFAQAQTRYIAVSRADTSNCSTPGNPCATINYAVAQALVGDTIMVASGTYAFVGSQIIDKSVIVMGQDSLTKPVITATASNIIEVTADSVTISNLRIEMGLTITDGIGGIVASDTYNCLVIDNNEIISQKYLV